MFALLVGLGGPPSPTTCLKKGTDGMLLPLFFPEAQVATEHRVALRESELYSERERERERERCAGCVLVWGDHASRSLR